MADVDFNTFECSGCGTSFSWDDDAGFLEEASDGKVLSLALFCKPCRSQGQHSVKGNFSPTPPEGAKRELICPSNGES